jgi:hypothetical protein
VAVLVVDFAGFGIREGFVGFGYFDEFLFGRVVVSGGSVLGWNWRIGRKERVTGSYRGGISC